MGPSLFTGKMRHSALRVDQNQLQVFWTRVRDSPEKILLSFIDLTEDWSKWKPTSPIEVMRPEKVWEGGNLKVKRSTRGPVHEPVNQLRDPYIYEEDDKTYLSYSVAGERGIAIAELFISKA